MKGIVFKNRYYMGVRPGLGVKTRDDNKHGYPFIVRNQQDKPIDPLMVFGETMRDSVDTNPWREEFHARKGVSRVTENERMGNAYGDHDDWRDDWGTGR